MRDYKVTKVSTRIGDSDSMSSDTESYTFRFIVLDSTANDYRVEWQFEDTPLADELTEDKYEDLGDQAVDLQLIYSTDNKGASKEVENWQEVAT